MLKIGIIVGSTRPNRVAPQVAQWTYDLAKQRKDAEFEIVDIKDFNLPILDEPLPSMIPYAQEHTKKWSAKIASFDGYIFITPEYNHGITGALKNAIDFLYKEWTNKVAGFVSYGSTGGVRAVEHMRGAMAEIQIADVRAHVSLSLYTDFENFSVLKPGPAHAPELTTLLDQVVAWSGALKTVRQQQATKIAA